MKLLNEKVKEFISNFSHTLFANLIALAVSTLVVLIIPKLIGVEEYGYWQLYLFYSSYVGVFHFGWNDGIYLRYGGENYENLDKDKISSQFKFLLIIQMIISIVIAGTAFLVSNDPNRKLILYMVSLCLVLTNSKVMLTFILQATYRIKAYARIILIDRLIYLLFLFLLIVIGVRDFKLMIVADLVGKLISLAYSAYICRDIILFNNCKINFGDLEIKQTISGGFALMASNYIGMLIIGIVRFGIERHWDVTTFGKISLTLSASNLMLIFISALGIVIYPILRRIDKDRLIDIYMTIRESLFIVLFGLLILYYPIKFFLSNWLPNYADSLKYMSLVFPIFIFEGKMSLLINNFLKTIRKEKLMLRINVLMVVVSIFTTYITAYILDNLIATIASIVFLAAVKTFIAEYYLSKMIIFPILKYQIMELILTITFILSGWIIDSWATVLIYSSMYLLFVFIRFKDVKHLLGKLKNYLNYR